ncbi:hypothetical protein [Tessaracoccus caeni]|uniref:hypothetical protein n=1 Tax=Tessaracoccus caeni TaxID=3031239 RepID=UPI0023DB09FB|nr:hypothetical protein [Tessaracoccus caeni]MDF1487153.1 hypothetical protein [Tessaracoccus caeni]
MESFPDDTSGDTPEQAEIRAGWQAYHQTLDKFAKDPTLMDLSEIQLVTVGQEAVEIVRSIQFFRDEGLKQVGDAVFRDVEIGEPSTNGDGVRTAHVTYCLDRTQIKAVHVDTNEEAEGLVAQNTRFDLLMEQGADDIWRAALLKTIDLKC